MDIEKLCSDAKLIGWSSETTIKHLYDIAEHFPQLSFSHNSRTGINAEVVGELRHGIYAIANLMRENATLQAENEKLRAELEQVKRCIEIVENQRDSAIKELENYMVQDVLDGNEPCAICAKASDTPCEYCNPKWRGQKED